MDYNWITLWWHKQICIPKVTIPTHWEILTVIWSRGEPWLVLLRNDQINMSALWNRRVTVCHLPSPSLSHSLPFPFALWSGDNILIDIYKGHRLIISNSSPLITHHWCYVHAYLLETPIGSTAFLMQIGRQLSSPSVMETEEAGLVCS